MIMKSLDGFHKFVQSSPALPTLSESQMQFGAFIQSPNFFSKTPFSFCFKCHQSITIEIECHFLQDITLSGEKYAKYHLPLLSHRKRRWHPTPVLLPGKSHGWRSLVGCSPWGRKESDSTERLHFHFSLSRIGEGNGNPLQCSCLENPRDRGAWWAAVYGVPQSRTHNWSDLAAAAAALTELTMFLQHQTLPILLTVVSMSHLPYSGTCLKNRIFSPSLYWKIIDLYHCVSLRYTAW